MAQSLRPANFCNASLINSGDRDETQDLHASAILPVPRAEAEALDLRHLPDHISPFHEPSSMTLIAIDFENGLNITSSGPSDFEAGLAILDIDDINAIQTGQAANQAISTYNLATGHPDYRQKASRRFVFGETVTFDHKDEIAAYIESLISRTSRVILVGHDIRNDLQALDSLQVDYSAFQILDTQRIASKMYPRISLNLRAVLLKLGCPYERLHCAGNDANFTLRALLLLAVQTPTEQSGLCPEKLAVLRAIALSTLPGTDAVQSSVLVVWKGRRENSRKQQSKTWSKETQDKIRADRAAKRLALA